MIRRLKTELKEDWTGKTRFPPRVVKELEVEYSDAERSMHRLLTEYGTMRRKQAGGDRSAQISVEFVLKTLKKRLFSSPAAFSHTIAQHIQTVDMPKPKATLGRSSVRDLRARLDSADEPIENDDEALEVTFEAFATAESVVAVDPAARKKLTTLQEWADKAAQRPDRKAEVLLEWLNVHVRQRDERVIIFTEYRHTQNWLMELLASAGLTGDRLTEQIYGGLDRDERERVKAAFQADPKSSPVRILLATDAASEGLDFQNYCHQIIHYEIPWNPNRLEQRNGRVDRHGQKAKEVLVYHFVGAGFQQASTSGRPPGDLEGDLEFLARAVLKIEQIRADLGSVGTVLATNVERAMLGDAATSRVLDSLGRDEATARTRRELQVLRNVETEIQQAYETLRQTRHDLDLEPERVLRAVATALELAGQPALKLTRVGGHSAWIIPPLGGTWAGTRIGLRHPFTGHERAIVFDDAVAQSLGDQVVHAHLNHPLVQRCLRLLRATLWGNRDGSHDELHRVTIRVVSDLELEEPAIVAHGRLVITGGDGERLHEQLVTAGGEIRGGRFSRLNVGQVDALLASETLPDQVPQDLKDQFIEIWPNIRDGLDAALRARRNDRTSGLLRDVKAREKQETEAITAILTELSETISRELHTPEILQLQIFTDGEERENAERDRNVLQDRLDRIPRELEEELGAIRRRYDKTEPRLFPVAVTWFIPRSLVLKR